MMFQIGTYYVVCSTLSILYTTWKSFSILVWNWTKYNFENTCIELQQDGYIWMYVMLWASGGRLYSIEKKRSLYENITHKKRSPSSNTFGRIINISVRKRLILFAPQIKLMPFFSWNESPDFIEHQAKLKHHKFAKKCIWIGTQSTHKYICYKKLQ